jgi:hypothetical protein
MKVELLAPGVEHGQDPDPCIEVLRVGGDLQESLRRAAKQQVVDQPRVTPGQAVELGGQR